MFKLFKKKLLFFWGILIVMLSQSLPLVNGTYVNASSVTSFVGVIDYVSGYSVRVYQNNGTVMQPTTKMLLDGTTWKVFDTSIVNGIEYYNLGGNQWVQSKFIKNFVAPKWDGQSYLTIGYEAGYGIAVYKDAGSSSVVPGKTLKNGTTWKVLSQKNVNGTPWYQLGSNQWVNGKYTLFGKVSSSSVKLSVPYHSQYVPVFAPWGCASTAMAMLVEYEGPTVDLRYAQDHLPMYPTPGGQKGNVYTGVGFGYVINSTALTKYAQNWNTNVRNITGSSVNTIKNLVLSGHPVLYYGFSSYQKLPGDQRRNHCKVIVGYDNGNFLIHDPLYYSSSDRSGSGGTRSIGYYNGYDNGAIYWSSTSKLTNEYAGSAISIK